MNKTDKLNSQIHNIIQNAGGEWGISAQFLDDDQPIFNLNPDKKFYAASTAKVPIAIAVLKFINDGKTKLGDKLVVQKNLKLAGTGVLGLMHDGLEVTIQDALALMLAQSDNTAAKLLVNHFSAAKINRVMREFEFVHTQLEVLKSGKFYYGDTTAHEMAKLLHGLYSNRFFKKSYSQMFLEIMKSCHLNWGIERYLPTTLSDGKTKLQVSNKEGTYEDNRHEIAIVWTPRPYVLAIFSKCLTDQRIHVDNAGVLAIGQISQIIYDSIEGTQNG